MWTTDETFVRQALTCGTCKIFVLPCESHLCKYKDTFKINGNMHDSGLILRMEELPSLNYTEQEQSCLKPRTKNSNENTDLEKQVQNEKIPKEASEAWTYFLNNLNKENYSEEVEDDSWNAMDNDEESFETKEMISIIDNDDVQIQLIMQKEINDLQNSNNRGIFRGENCLFTQRTQQTLDVINTDINDSVNEEPLINQDIINIFDGANVQMELVTEEKSVSNKVTPNSNTIQNNDHTCFAEIQNNDLDIVDNDNTRDKSIDDINQSSTFTERDYTSECNEVPSVDIEYIPVHDRIISTCKPNYPEFLHKLKKNDVKILYHASAKQYIGNVKNKRIMLIGSQLSECTECSVVIESCSQILYHFKSNHPDVEIPTFSSGDIDEYIASRLFNCTECYAVLNSYKTLINHFKALHQTVPLPEIYSNETVEYAVSYTSPAELKYVCPVCQKNLYGSKWLTKHLQAIHKDYFPYKCHKCGKKFKTKCRWQYHVDRFAESKICYIRKCPVCPKVLTNRDELREHMKIHKDFVCDKCGRGFATLRYLNDHLTTHQKRGIKKLDFLCSACGKTFNCLQSLQRHMTRHEENPVLRFMCDKCPKVFKRNRSLKNHQQGKHETVQKIECGKCGKLCSSRMNLQAHNRLKHSNIQKYICTICGKGFLRHDYFKRHIKYHTDEPHGQSVGAYNTRKRKYNFTVRTSKTPVQCKFCLKSFANVYLLRSHITSHAKFNRFKCKFCNMTFSNKANTYRHMKLHEDTQYKFRCDICWKKIDTKEELNKHVLNHNRPRRYKCEECLEKFARKYMLETHMLEKHINEEDIEYEKSMLLKEGLKEFLLYDE